MQLYSFVGSLTVGGQGVENIAVYEKFGSLVGGRELYSESVDAWPTWFI